MLVRVHDWIEQYHFGKDLSVLWRNAHLNSKTIIFGFASHTFTESHSYPTARGLSSAFQVTDKTGPDEFPESLGVLFLEVTAQSSIYRSGCQLIITRVPSHRTYMILMSLETVQQFSGIDIKYFGGMDHWSCGEFIARRTPGRWSDNVFVAFELRWRPSLLNSTLPHIL